MNLLETKIALLGQHHQLVMIDAEGRLLDSCDSLILLKPHLGQYLWDVLIVFQGLEDAVRSLEPGDPPLELPLMVFQVDGQSCNASIELSASVQGPRLLWLKSADHHLEGKLRRIQQHRNETAILLEQIEEKERNLAESKLRLEADNRSMERFTYLLSHDIRSPLQAIGHLSKWIAEDLSEGRHGEVPAQLQLLQSRVKRLEGLVEGMLQYSRAGFFRWEPQEIDISAMLEDLTQAIFSEAADRIKLPEACPPLRGSRKALQHVLTQLLKNARDFGLVDGGSVQVTCRDIGDSIQFSVADNGPGIDPHDHEGIFEIFQTLQSKDLVETAGVGLTITKKIVEEAGGKIWVESGLGQGATFHFTWPKEAKAA